MSHITPVSSDKCVAYTGKLYQVKMSLHSVHSARHNCLTRANNIVSYILHDNGVFARVVLSGCLCLARG